MLPKFWRKTVASLVIITAPVRVFISSVMSPHENPKSLTVLAVRWFIPRLTAGETVRCVSVTLVAVRTLATGVSAGHSVVAANAVCARKSHSLCSNVDIRCGCIHSRGNHIAHNHQ